MRKIALFLLFINVLVARGGGGGHGGFGGERGGDFRGGGDFGNFDMARGPTLSRADYGNRTIGNEARNDQNALRNDVRPYGDTARNDLNVRGDTARDKLGNYGDAARDKLGNDGNAVRNDFGRGDDATKMRQDVQNSMQFSNRNFAQNGKEFNDSVNQSIQRANQGATAVQSSLRATHPDLNNLFSDSFYSDHNLATPFNHPGADLWAATRWGELDGALGWGGAAPIYYDDNGNPIYLPQNYNPNSSTTTTTTTITTPTSLNDVEIDQLIAEVTDPTQNSDNWMPLGVFAVGQDPSVTAFSNMFIQLSVDKQGNIAGTYFNSTSNKAYQLAGTVNKQTQQAAWKLSNATESPVMYTGLFNLTQDATAVQIMFSDLTVQTWYLVRIKK